MPAQNGARHKKGVYFLGSTIDGELDPTDAALVARARGAGFADVLRHLEETEGADAGMYDAEPEAPTSMSEDEREHIEVFQHMRTSLDEPAAPTPPPVTRMPRAAAAGPSEPWHRGDKSGSTRAAVFGISDGLVSNTALVMGFAGAAPRHRWYQIHSAKWMCTSVSSTDPKELPS